MPPCSTALLDARVLPFHHDRVLVLRRPADLVERVPMAACARRFCERWPRLRVACSSSAAETVQPRFLAGEGYDVTGVDPSTSGIAIARRFEAPNLRFAVGSTADDLAERYGTYNAVVSLEVIEHCASAREFMACFSALVAPGGVAILSTPYHGLLKNLAIIASGRFDRHFDPLWEGGHLKFFTEAKLRELFREFGFSKAQFPRPGRVPAFAKSTVAVLQKTGAKPATAAG